MDDKMRVLAPICGTAGAILGVGVQAAALFEPSVLSLVAAGFFLLSNAISDDVNNTGFPSCVCSLLGAFLGYGFGAAAHVYWLVLVKEESADPRSLLAVPLFLAVVCIFHIAEFLFTAAFHPQDIEFRAFLLTPVPAAGYSIAMVAALCEFWIWRVSFGPSGIVPGNVGLCLMWVGVVLSLLGWAMRTAALFTAQANFTHIVAWRKLPSHVLVTTGVYSICRHPGYLGWFIWSVSTQLVLGNPFCLVAYSFVSWRFFAGRIPSEEQSLLQFFGDEYMAYARRVPCGIPCISALP